MGMRRWVAALVLLTVVFAWVWGQFTNTINQTANQIDTVRQRLDETESRVRKLEARVALHRARADLFYRQIKEMRGEIEHQIDTVHQRLDKWEILKLRATGYAPHDPGAMAGACHDGNPWSTATGTVPGPGTIAVNPREIPYGTRMYVQGYGWGVAEDTGAAMRNGTGLIDLYFSTRKEALKWNRDVLVLIERREREK